MGKPELFCHVTWKCQTTNASGEDAKGKTVHCSRTPLKLLWERGQVILIARGALPITFAPLTPGKPHLHGSKNIICDGTVQA